MIRTIQGLRFRVLSPSAFILDASDATIAETMLVFVGPHWCLEVTTHKGGKYYREFPTFQAAIDVLLLRSVA